MIPAKKINAQMIKSPKSSNNNIINEGFQKAE